MAPHDKKSSIGSFVSENKLRLVLIGFLTGAVIAVSCLCLMSFAKTFYLLRAGSRDYSSTEYHQLLGDFDTLYYLDPEIAFQLIEAETEFNPNQVDQLEGLIRFVSYYQFLGKTDQILETYWRILDNSKKILSENTYPNDRAVVYYFAITAARGVGDLTLENRLYTEMADLDTNTILSSSDIVSIAKNYYYLAYAAYDHGYKTNEWATTSNYYDEMVDELESRVDETSTTYEIITAYSYMTDLAILFSDARTARNYQKDMKTLLLLKLGFISGSEEKALINRYLGNAELLQGNASFAAAFYRKMVDYAPTASNINLLAKTYADSGNYECSYKYYHQLLEAEDPTGSAFHMIARNAIWSLERFDINCEIDLCCP